MSVPVCVPCIFLHLLPLVCVFMLECPVIFDLPSVRENSQMFVLLSIGQLLRSTACFCYCTESVEYGLIWPKDCQLRRKAADFYGHGAAVGENSGYLTDLCVFVCVCVCLSVSVFVCMCLCLFVCLPLVTPYQVLPHQVMT